MRFTAISSSMPSGTSSSIIYHLCRRHKFIYHLPSMPQAKSSSIIYHLSSINFKSKIYNLQSKIYNTALAVTSTSSDALPIPTTPLPPWSRCQIGSSLHCDRPQEEHAKTIVVRLLPVAANRVDEDANRQEKNTGSSCVAEVVRLWFAVEVARL